MHSHDALRLEQNGQLFADNICEYISLIINWRILIQISLKFIPEGSIDIKAALV